MNYSASFRKNKRDILKGIIPGRYTKILNHVKGDNIFEVGCAEGVLSLLIANENPDANVIGLERRSNRHEMSLKLKKEWTSQGKQTKNCKFINSELIDSFDLLKGMDTFIGIKVIYYFLHDTDKIFSEISKNCKKIILGGNCGRYGLRDPIHDVTKIKVLGSSLDHNTKERNPNYYATAKGMEEIGKKYGYETTLLIPENYMGSWVDPLYIGTKIK